MISCPVTKCRAIMGKCPICLDPMRYRQETGMCETCGQPMKTHTKCQACGVLVGKGHPTSSLDEMRGHKICSHCQLAWGVLDQKTKRKLGREAMWLEFLSPGSKVFHLPQGR